MSETATLLRQVANGLGSLKNERGDYGLADTAADELDALRARLEKAEAERELQPMSSAPEDGTPILCFCNMADYPFIAHFGHVGRYTSTPKMWIGHKFGAMSDVDILGWTPLPKPALKSHPQDPPSAASL